MSKRETKELRTIWSPLSGLSGFLSGTLKSKRRAIQAIEELVAKLGGDVTCIRDWQPLGSNSAVDMLILGKHGVLVVQIASLVGRLECRVDRWYVVGRNGKKQNIESLSHQCKKKARAVAKLLREMNQGAPVLPILVFEDEVDLILRSPSIPAVRQCELEDFLATLPASWRCDERIFAA